MANVDNPAGFQLAGPLISARWMRKGATAIYRGDMCAVGADGLTVEAAATGTQLVGVAQAYAKAADTHVLVANDPDQHYYVQDDGSGTPSVSFIGSLADIIGTDGVTTWGGTSRHELDASSLSQTDGQLRIVGYYPTDDVDSDYCRWLVVINEHSWAKKIAGI